MDGVSNKMSSQKIQLKTEAGVCGEGKEGGRGGE